MKAAWSILPAGKLLGKKTKLLVEGQAKIDYKALAEWRKTKEQIIWFHCASLGEFEQGRPVLEEFRKENPEYGVLLTFFSPSGYEVRKNYNQADFICYLPWDTAGKARRFVRAAMPDLVVFVKYEFWPNIILEIKKTGARLIGVSVILRENQAFFRSWGGFFRKTLNHFDYLFVQNQTSARLLSSIGYTRFEVAGDTRFDRVRATAEQAAEVPGIDKFIGNSEKVFVVGSAWPEDMEVLKPFIEQHPKIKFIIAPHEIKEEQIQRWTKETSAVRYSELDKFRNGNVLIIDCIGLLSKLYRYATYAFVGGGFKTGLHNILEPAVFGVPIFFGNKKYEKFQEALDLIDLGVAFAIDDNLEEVFDDIDLDLIKSKSERYVNENVGATRKILAYLGK